MPGYADHEQQRPGRRRIDGSAPGCRGGARIWSGETPGAEITGFVGPQRLAPQRRTRRRRARLHRAVLCRHPADRTRGAAGTRRPMDGTDGAISPASRWRSLARNGNAPLGHPLGLVLRRLQVGRVGADRPPRRLRNPHRHRIAGRTGRRAERARLLQRAR